MMKEILNINERILYLIENQYNDNRKKFAESIGYSAQVISNIVSGRKSSPSYDVLFAIVSTNVYINSEWLLTGNGEMLKKEIDPPEVVDKINYKELAEARLEIIDGLKFKLSIYEKEKVQTKSTSTLEPELARELVR